MNDALARSVVQTLCYFDIFDYPLTREELFRFLWQPPDMSYARYLTLLDELMQGDLDKTVEEKQGYLFLKERSILVKQRQKKVWLTEEKMKIAVRAAQKLRYIPFVHAFFVCNQLPVGVKKESDIDVFIVVRQGRMWMTRALITSVLSFFLLRRTQKSIADMICLSFYVTNEHLDLSGIRVSAPDVYQAYWNVQLIPVYDPNDLQKYFLQQNTWTREILPRAFAVSHMETRWKVRDHRVSRLLKSIAEWCAGGFVGWLFEKHIRFLQIQKMKWGEKILHPDADKSVVISDSMLKFHENDRKAYFQREWHKRCKSCGV